MEAGAVSVRLHQGAKAKGEVVATIKERRS